jgi:hypothetical protein
MNKKYVIPFIVFLLGKSVFGQEMERKITLQADPILLVYDIFALGMWDDDTKFLCMDMEGQYKINDKFNIALTVFFLISDSMNTTYGYTEYDFYKEEIFRINIEPMLLYRPFKTGLKGFYLGLYPEIGLQSIKNKYGDRVYADLGLGLNIGYKWILRNGFTMQLGGGICKTWTIPEKPEYSITSFISESRIPLRNFDVVLLDFKIGYSF